MNNPGRYLVARGDMLLDDGDKPALKSELPGVSDEAWSQFVRAMMTKSLSDVSTSNALGMFEMTPRRLHDLGILDRLMQTRLGKKTVWVAVFVPLLTSDEFLKNPRVQYAAFSKSMKDYMSKIESGEIEKPSDMSSSGALAILHRCGPKGLDTWKNGEQFPATKATFDRTSGVF